MADKSFSVNAVSNWATLIVHTLISIILTPLILSLLGDDLYGTWVLLVSFIAVSGILDLGISSAISRFISYNLGKNDRKGIQSIYSTALALFLSIGLAIILITIYLSSFLSEFFSIKDNLKEEFIIAIRINSLTVALTLINNTKVAVLRAYEKFPHLNAVKILSELIRFFLIMLFARGHFPFIRLSAITLLCAVIQCILFFILSTYIVEANLFSFSAISGSTIKKLIFFAFPVALTIFAEMLRTRLDTFVIAKILVFSSVTVYTVGSRFITFLTRFLVSLNGVLDPRFAFYAGQSNKGEIEKLASHAIEFITFTSLALGFLLIWIGPGLLNAWVGPAFSGAYGVLVILSIGQSLAATQMPIISLLFAINKHKILPAVVLIEGLSNLVLSIILAPIYGIEGVAIGTLIPIILKVLILPVWVQKVIGIPLGKIYGPLMKGALSYSILYLLLQRWQPKELNWPGVLIWGVGFTVLIFAFTTAFLFSIEWKKRIILRITRAFSFRRSDNE